MWARRSYFSGSQYISGKATLLVGSQHICGMTYTYPGTGSSTYVGLQVIFFGFSVHIWKSHSAPGHPAHMWGGRGSSQYISGTRVLISWGLEYISGTGNFSIAPSTHLDRKPHFQYVCGITPFNFVKVWGRLRTQPASRPGDYALLYCRLL